MPTPIPFWATSTERQKQNVELIHSEDFRNDDGNYTFE
jgi:hypothetical protein